MKVEGTDDKYPREPRPCTVDMSCGVEMILDKFVIADDRYPRVPSPCIVERRVGEEIALRFRRYPPSPVIVDTVNEEIV